MANLLRGLEHLRLLDYGAGNGLFAQCMTEHGFVHVDGFDPFSQPSRPVGKFDVIICNEVLEHSPDPIGTMRDMAIFWTTTDASFWDSRFSRPRLRRCARAGGIARRATVIVPPLLSARWHSLPRG